MNGPGEKAERMASIERSRAAPPASKASGSRLPWTIELRARATPEALSPAFSLCAPILFRFALGRRRRGILDLEPLRRAAARCCTVETWSHCGNVRRKITTIADQGAHR